MKLQNNQLCDRFTLRFMTKPFQTPFLALVCTWENSQELVSFSPSLS